MDKEKERKERRDFILYFLMPLGLFVLLVVSILSMKYTDSTFIGVDAISGIQQHLWRNIGIVLAIIIIFCVVGYVKLKHYNIVIKAVYLVVISLLIVNCGLYQGTYVAENDIRGYENGFIGDVMLLLKASQDVRNKDIEVIECESYKIATIDRVVNEYSDEHKTNQYIYAVFYVGEDVVYRTQIQEEDKQKLLNVMKTKEMNELRVTKNAQILVGVNNTDF